MQIINKILIIIAVTSLTAFAQNTKPKKNRVFLGAGYGLDGLVFNKRDAIVKERFGTVVSADYERKFENNNIIGVSVMSNKTVVIKLGKEF